jgi:hypothetical protein
VEAGIIDPTKAVRIALENAVPSAPGAASVWVWQIVSR